MADFSAIRNFYWHLRYSRNLSVKRRYYRYIAKEKNACMKQASIWKNCVYVAVIWLTRETRTLKKISNAI